MGKTKYSNHLQKSERTKSGEPGLRNHLTPSFTQEKLEGSGNRKEKEDSFQNVIFKKNLNPKKNRTEI